MADEANTDSSNPSDPPPPLAALFLIKFDLKVGYTISWKASLPSVPLEGVVEYKSLPSGLHNVKEDLVYFVHESWAGVSAFRNAEASAEEERGARFLSVGALVTLGDGRLGRCWEHAKELKELAGRLVDDAGDVGLLEGYWERYKQGEGGENGGEEEGSRTIARRRNRALSSLTLTDARHLQQRLPEYHPAYSILGYLDTFGPLAFPLQRMALLRKRILVITPAPVRGPCEYVYDLSILSSLPHSLSYELSSLSLARLRPLFNLGIHDIPYLTTLAKSYSSSPNNGALSSPPEESELEESKSFIACTTDEILAMKPELYDVLVELPQPSRSLPSSSHIQSRRPKNKGAGMARWPVIKLSATGEELRATQRDLRRYRSLRRALAPLTKLPQDSRQRYEAENDEDDEETHLLFNSVHGGFEDGGEEELQHRQDEEKVTERASWSELAYSSFMWWASAGEREEGLKTEDDLDAGLLGNLPDIVGKEVDRRGYHDSDDDDYEENERNAEGEGGRSAEVEMAIIAYFHRISKSLFESVHELLEEDAPRPASSEAIAEGEVSEDEAEGAIGFETEDLRRCGLDVWSERDRQFISEFVDLWFERDVDIRGVGIDCCGMHIY